MSTMTLFSTSQAPSLFASGGAPAWATSASSRTTVRGATVNRGPHPFEAPRAERWHDDMPMGQPFSSLGQAEPAPERYRVQGRTASNVAGLALPARPAFQAPAPRRTLGMPPAPEAWNVETWVQPGLPAHPHRSPRPHRQAAAMPQPPRAMSPGFWDGLWAASMIQAAPGLGWGHGAQGVGGLPSMWDARPRDVTPPPTRPRRQGPGLLARATTALCKATALGVAALFVPLPATVVVPLYVTMLWLWAR